LAVGRAVIVGALAVAAGAGGPAIASAAWMAPGSGASGSSGGVWGNALEVPLSATLNGGNATVLSVSCAAPGDCSAGGQYEPTPGDDEAFVVSEVNGTWGNAEEVPGSGSLNEAEEASVNSVSCEMPGDCSAGGDYLDDGGLMQAFVVNEENGAWGNAQEVPGSGDLNTDGGATVESVSCGSPGNCSAGGTYDDNSGNQAFVVNEVKGTWADAIEVPGSGDLNADGDAEVQTVSCASAGNCSAGGFYQDGSSNTQAFVVSEVKGAWGNAKEVPGSGTLNTGGQGYVLSVSCPTAGNCSAGGVYKESSQAYQAFVVDEVNGVWGNAKKVPGSGTLNAGGNARVASVSCPAPGDCSAAGYYGDHEGEPGSQVFVVSEVNGTWGNATEIPGSGTLNAGDNAVIGDATLISCAASGDCAVGGSYRDSSGDTQAFVASEVDGTWGNAQEVPGTGTLNASGFASINSVSCSTPGDCGAGGTYEDGSQHSQAFVVNQIDPSSTAVAVSPAKVIFGKTPAEQVSVTVTPTTASGTVTVTARPAKGRRIWLCGITLTAGAGSCGLSATKLGVGTYPIVAVYKGSPALSGSASAPVTLTVSAARSATALTLSAASVSYKRQSAERFTVTVRPQFTGQPAGSVTITAYPAKGRPVQVCKVTLAKGKASCQLAAKKLAVGSYKVTAAYLGTTDFRPSASAKRALKITG
jgi:hypothetical protein